MGRKRTYQVGEFWLDKRPDGRSPFWQICWYDERARTTRSLSTGCEGLEDAKVAILAHVQEERAKGFQQPQDAMLLATMLLYWQEHGAQRINSSIIRSSMRIWTGFLTQDPVGPAAKVADLTPVVVERFKAWRSHPHSYDVEWAGERHAADSPGVNGETIQRNIADLKAALNHAVRQQRIPYAPAVANVRFEQRSAPRDVRLSLKQLGAIVGYAAYDLPFLRWVLGMIATGCRPDAVLRWDVGKQWEHRGDVFSTHPHGAPRTRKRNADVPVIPGFRPWLEAWADCPHDVVKSRKTAWRNMRAALGFHGRIVPKVIRHTIATELRARGVPQSDVEGLLGHQMSNRVTAVYAKYDPQRLAAAKQALSAIWDEVCAEAKKWLADHFRTTDPKGRVIVVDNRAEKA
jgi:integrase